MKRTTLTLALLATGCTDMLPEEELIEKERFLAVRALHVDDDPAPTATPRAELLPGDPMRVDALLVDPDGPMDLASQDLAWLVCPLPPGLPAFACISALLPLELADIPACPAAPGAPDMELPPVCRLSGAAPTYTLPLFSQALAGFSLELVGIMSIPGGPGLDTCAETFLGDEHDLPDGCITAVHTVPIGPRSALFPGGDPSGAPSQDVNTHPRIVGFDVEVLDADGDPVRLQSVSAGETVTIEPGERLEIVATTVPEDEQLYYIPVNNGASFNERNEPVKGRWFRDGGTFRDDGANAMLLGDNQSVGFRPDEMTDPVTIYFVLRDDRSGISWATFDVATAG